MGHTVVLKTCVCNVCMHVCMYQFEYCLHPGHMKVYLEHRDSLPVQMNSTKVQNPRRKMQVALTPLESSVFMSNSKAMKQALSVTHARISLPHA